MASRYQKALAEIGKARNQSLTAESVRGIRFNRSQEDFLKTLAIKKENPTQQDITKRYPGFSEAKLARAYNFVKTFRRNIAHLLEMKEVAGVHDKKVDGYVYLVVNEKFEGWVKCGMTKNIEGRLSQYNHNDPTASFVILAKKEVENKRKIESVLLLEFKAKAKLSKGEWFKIDKEQAIEIFDKI